MSRPKQRYQVTVTKNRKIKTVTGYVTAPDGYVIHSCIQVAETAQQARKLVRDYYLPPNTKYDKITAVPINELD